MRPFNWNRVVLDRDGKLGKPGAVLNKELTGYDPAWKGVKVVWRDIHELKVTDIDEIHELFGVGGSRKVTIK